MEDLEVRSVYNLSESRGWAFVEEFIKQKRQAIVRELTDTEFDDLSEVAKLQGQVQTCNVILNFVNTRRENYLKEDK